MLQNSGLYLIDKHTILTAPSIQVLNLTHQQRQLIGFTPIIAETLIFKAGAIYVASLRLHELSLKRVVSFQN